MWNRSISRTILPRSINVSLRSPKRLRVLRYLILLLVFVPTAFCTDLLVAFILWTWYNSGEASALRTGHPLSRWNSQRKPRYKSPRRVGAKWTPEAEVEIRAKKWWKIQFFQQLQINFDKTFCSQESSTCLEISKSIIPIFTTVPSCPSLPHVLTLSRLLVIGTRRLLLWSSTLLYSTQPILFDPKLPRNSVL